MHSSRGNPSRLHDACSIITHRLADRHTPTGLALPDNSTQLTQLLSREAGQCPMVTAMTVRVPMQSLARAYLRIAEPRYGMQHRTCAQKCRQTAGGRSQYKESGVEEEIQQCLQAANNSMPQPRAVANHKTHTHTHTGAACNCCMTSTLNTTQQTVTD